GGRLAHSLTMEALRETFAPHSGCDAVRLRCTPRAKRDDHIGPGRNLAAGHARLERGHWVGYRHSTRRDRNRSRRPEPSKLELQLRHDINVRHELHLRRWRLQLHWVGEF